MADSHPQQNKTQQKEPQSPFSPLQSGCAFVMLANMLLYLVVVAFVFNLLDPSRLDATYRARRGFTAPAEPEAQEDRVFRQQAEERREAGLKTQAQTIAGMRAGTQPSASRTAGLSQGPARSPVSGAPAAPERPQAALTEGTIRGGIRRVYNPKMRQYDLSMFPRYAQQRYDVFSSIDQTAQTIRPETYSPIPVQIAPGLPFPFVSLPVFGDGSYVLYTPSKSLPGPVRGGRPLVTSPAVGASTYYTNYLREAAQPPEPEKNRDVKDDS
jgi:hypothetical protein